ncbi:hypothetical protein CC78DRAFT_606679 [Lojkania enalia]|uniref:Uncharacterized protein n=1 Tax=Lojkania enalia TaxID=147567 RepID=A0A9P4KJP4_9PLEO|nr:hypothetical protein CC78DRAFT_606679 [Didymosphaeria enalia]
MAQYVKHNFTISYRKSGELLFTRDLLNGIPYHVDSERTLGWVPIVELARDDADVDLILIAGNDMNVRSAIDDPVFSTHRVERMSATSKSFYKFDNPTSPVGCASQHQICNPVNNKYSNLTGALLL